MGSESFTYHERKALGFGTVKERLGKVRRVDGPGRCALRAAARAAAAAFCARQTVRCVLAL
jgi:hypothetical protein